MEGITLPFLFLCWVLQTHAVQEVSPHRLFLLRFPLVTSWPLATFRLIRTIEPFRHWAPWPLSVVLPWRRRPWSFLTLPFLCRFYLKLLSGQSGIGEIKVAGNIDVLPHYGIILPLHRIEPSDDSFLGFLDLRVGCAGLVIQTSVERGIERSDGFSQIRGLFLVLIKLPCDVFRGVLSE